MIDGNRVFRDKMTVAPVSAIGVFGCCFAAHGLHFDASGSSDTDLNRPVLHERPIQRIIIVSKGSNHAQHEIAAATALPHHSTRLVAPGKIAALALEQARGPGPVS